MELEYKANLNLNTEKNLHALYLTDICMYVFRTDESLFTWLPFVVIVYLYIYSNRIIYSSLVYKQLDFRKQTVNLLTLNKLEDCRPYKIFPMKSYFAKYYIRQLTSLKDIQSFIMM